MTGHHSFDHAAHEGNLWLRKLDERLHSQTPGQSYSALRATLQVLRDRLSPEMAVHLSAQLPMVIRGLFFEGWKMSRTPSVDDTIDDFCNHIADKLPPGYPYDSMAVAAAVFEVMWGELDLGETAKVIDFLPRDLKTLWPTIARRA
jgi:uncharacterized protein (DUF2267 family)